MSLPKENYDIQQVSFHEDDRAQRLLDVFELKDGQINVSYVNSTSHVVAWHKHLKQTDRWVCLKGSFKVGLVEDENDEVDWTYLSDKRQEVLIIPPGWYHGYRALEPGSILMYHMDCKYDPDDELRVEIGHFDEDWGIENR